MKMKAVVTGAGGFLGSHLADLLVEKGLDVYAVINEDTKNLGHLGERIKIIRCDIADKDAVENLISGVKPDYVFHMAAQSFVIPSWQDPERTFKTNILGTLYLLDAVKKENINPVIAVACSSAEYGMNFPDEIPIKETKIFRPSSPYAVSKVATDMISELYAKTHKMKIIRIRFFNISGPRKTMDACSDFAKGVAEAERGKPFMTVGNLDGIRDITDARDAVRAVWLLTEKGVYGDVYNVCSGQGYKVRDLLDKLLAMSTKKITVKEKDPEKLRPIDDPLFIGDNSKIRKLGWEPKIKIEQTLRDTLEYWRENL
ncbi:MAG: GDP-mannose 4,6-dehydratase [Candidatus Aenigmarchaeota archaeon]|nr:GDP-mannose 4,6-dehydratase [Candidatus Aenigmarchaeota archaeon]